MRWIASEEEKESRLSDVVVKNPALHLPSGKQARRLIDAGLCSINGRIKRLSSYRVQVGDVIDVVDGEYQKISHAPVQILYEDEWLCLINKPPGLVVDPTLINEALQKKVYLVHRLDKNTSGVLIVAKDVATKVAIEDQFRKRTIRKVYLAIVDGKLQDIQGTIDRPLAMKERQHGEVKWGVEEGGKSAITDFSVIASCNQASLVSLTPKTGRTHQLRVHMASIGHPILGDLLYSDVFLCPRRPSRHLLHAWKITLTHPATKDKLFWTAPLPKDMQDMVTFLFRKCPTSSYVVPEDFGSR
jgi:RluA family pseudouridine synthase